MAMHDERDFGTRHAGGALGDSGTSSSGPQSSGMGHDQSTTEQVKHQAKQVGHEMKERVGQMGEQVADRVGQKAESGLNRVAGGIDRMSDKLDSRASAMDQQGAFKRKAGQAMHRASDSLEDSADYLRTRGIGNIRDDLSMQIREHPFLSVGAALGTGFLFGRLMGGGHEEEEEAEEKELRRHFGGKHREMSTFEGLKGPLGRVLLAGATALVARQIRSRVGGR